MKYNPNMPSQSYDEADAKAIMNSSIPKGLVGDALRFDSAEDASIFFARELDYVKAKTYDVLHPEFTAEKHFPISHEVNPGAETITYYSFEKTGFAKIISNYSTDLPRADVKGKPTTSNIKSIGDSYGYSMQDMRASRMAGKSLDIRRGGAARYAIDRKANEIAWAGDKDAGLMGVLTDTNNIPVFTAGKAAADGTSTAWNKKTADEIVEDISGALSLMATTTQNVEVPDTLLLPPSVIIKLSSKRIEGTATTLWEYINKAFPKLTFDEANELEAGSVTTNPYKKNVGLLYKKDPEKFTIEIPMQFYQYTAQPKGLEIEVPCEERHAGAVIYYPMSLMIIPGI